MRSICVFFYIVLLPVVCTSYQVWDLNQDKKIFIEDIMVLAQHWLETGDFNNIPSDINNDYSVDFDDFNILASHWMERYQADVNSISYPKVFVEDFSDKDEQGWYHAGSGNALETVPFGLCSPTSIKASTSVSNTDRWVPAVLGRDYGKGNELNLHGCNFKLSYYVPPSMADMPASQDFTLYFYADEGDANRASFGSLPHKPGWNTIEFCESTLNFLGSMTDLSQVRRFGLTGGIAPGAKDIYGQFSGPSNQWHIILGCFEAWLERSSKGAVVFTFDDGFRSSYEKGIKYLSSLGFPSIFYICPESVGTSDSWGDLCTWEEIADAQRLGSFIATHSLSATPADNPDDVRAYYQRQKNLMLEHGYYTGANYWCIPAGTMTWGKGMISPEEHYNIARDFFEHIRGTMAYWIDIQDGAGGEVPSGNVWTYSRSPDNVHWIGAANMKHLNDAHNKSLVDRVVKNKGVLSFMIHTIGEGDMLTEAEFKSVADYVKSKVDAGLLEVITFEDIVKGR